MKLTETFDDETMEAFDDETLDDESFLGDIGRILTAPITAPLDAVNRLIGARPSRPPLPQIQVSPTGKGVDTASLTTPKGTATIRLPEKVVTEDEFRQATQRLQTAINRNTERLNTTQSDIQSLTKRLGVIVADTHRDIAKVQKEQRIAISKLRKEQSSQAMMNMMIGFMTQQQLQGQLEDHRHEAPSGSVSNIDVGNNTALMLLPMMMSGTQDTGADNNMMMLMMMMAMN